MESALVMALVVVAIAVGLCSRRVRSFLLMIAMRRFFDQYMKRPRYRLFNPRDEDESKR